MSNAEIQCGRDIIGCHLRVPYETKNGRRNFLNYENQYNYISESFLNEKIPFKECTECYITLDA